MSNISDQYSRSIDNHRIYYDIERGNRDIEYNRKYRSMEECCPTPRIDMWKYSFCTPEIEHITDCECEECDHRKEYR